MKQDNSWHKVFDITYISILRLYIWMYLHHKGSPSLQEMYVLLYNKLLCCLKKNQKKITISLNQMPQMDFSRWN